MPLEQAGVEAHRNAVPGFESVVPLGHAGVGGVTVQVPVTALKIPVVQVGVALPTQTVAEPVPDKV